MSYYTKYADVEALLTTTTTNTIASTDALVVFNVASGKMYQTTPVAVYNASQAGGSGGGAAQILTTNSTGTNINNFGITLLKSTAGTSSAWLLTDPTQPGQIKTIAFVSSTTSTNFAVNTVAASIESSLGFAGTLVNFGSTQTGAMVNAGQSVTLASLTNTSWIVIGRNSNATSVTSGLLLATSFGPYFA